MSMPTVAGCFLSDKYMCPLAIKKKRDRETETTQPLKVNVLFSSMSKRWDGALLSQYKAVKKCIRATRGREGKTASKW